MAVTTNVQYGAFPAGTTLGKLANGATTVSANSTSAALTITQTGTGNALVVEDSTSPDSTPFVIDADGRVIQGTTASIATPNYAGTASGNLLQTLGSVSSGVGYVGHLLGMFNNSTAGAGIVAVKSRNASVGSHTIVSSNDKLFAITAAGSDGSNYIRAADISFEVDGTPGTNDMPGRLVFSTTPDGSAAPVEAMRIDAVQRVIDKAGVAQTPTRSTVASGSTIVLTTATNHLLYDNAATAAALTVTLPSANITDGQIITIATRSAITALTVNGGTIYGAPTTLAAGGFASFIYSSGAAAWFRKG